jgi:hypothetical protein
LHTSFSKKESREQQGIEERRREQRRAGEET